MKTISARCASVTKNVKGVPREASTYRSARRNAVRDQIRKDAESKRSFPGWGSLSDVPLLGSVSV